MHSVRSVDTTTEDTRFLLAKHDVFQVGTLRFLKDSGFMYLSPLRAARKYLKVSVISKKFGARSGEEGKRKYVHMTAMKW